MSGRNTAVSVFPGVHSIGTELLDHSSRQAVNDDELKNAT